jgi:hypothetical protein
MIKIIINEHMEGDIAVRSTVVTFFNLVIFSQKHYTTNTNIVSALTTSKKCNKVKGFYETNNKSKTNK